METEGLIGEAIAVVEGLAGTEDTVIIAGGVIDMICLDSNCPYCRDGHHCTFVETDDLPCMMEDE